MQKETPKLSPNQYDTQVGQRLSNNDVVCATIFAKNHIPSGESVLCLMTGTKTFFQRRSAVNFL